jgi:hypothetical protein
MINIKKQVANIEKNVLKDIFDKRHIKKINATTKN